MLTAEQVFELKDTCMRAFEELTVLSDSYISVLYSIDYIDSVVMDSLDSYYDVADERWTKALTYFEEGNFEESLRWSVASIEMFHYLLKRVWDYRVRAGRRV
jgi:hypothetical protein